ncbi:hypothetical protein BDR07DRAFT_1386987 [Suillus spraguei]|nr:hypothetical protein BDR07DRAFT_1386987 [Suillus spraguei]
MSNNDFFTSVPFSGQHGRAHSTDQENVVSFAHAIAARFGPADLLTARILPDEQPPSQNIILPPPILPPPSKPVSSSSLASSSSSSSSSTSIPVNPSDLAAYLADSSILILDIRPHAAHTAARIHRALSLSIPSTLIKRPLFGLSKLVQMLPSSSARARFAAWPTANRILVYDADSAIVPDTSNIAGLLRKFRAEGFTGELAWVKGGFQAVWRDARYCTTTDHPSPDEDDLEGTASGALRPKHLPKAAFSLSTTTASNAASGTPAVANAANPFFDTIRQNLELSHGITERIPLRLPRRVRRRIKDLPFLWLQDIASRSALRPYRSSFPGETSVGSGSESSDDPHESDPDSNDPDVEEGAETLAMQFYRIELAEQRRLRSVMEHHARESEVSAYAAASQAYTLGEGGQDIIGAGARSAGVNTLPSTPVQGAFPFSITAGVEKGAKNRYNHIWPFEHARVRLHDCRHQGSHPGGTSKRDKDDKTKVVCVSAGAGITGSELSITFTSSSESQLASPSNPQSPNVPEEDQNMLMSVDRNPSSSMPPPSSVLMTPFYSQSAFHTPLSVPMTPFGPLSSALTRGNVPMTPFYPFPRSSGGGSDAYFPAFTPSETSQIPPIPEGAQTLSPPRLDTCAPKRSGGFLAPSISSTLPRSPQSAGPKAVSPLVMPSCTPLGSQREMFNLKLPRESISQGPISATNTSLPQFNMTVVPPKDRPRDPSPADDYVNASYVQPLGTRKRYIATQGPLPATFVDFWTLVWEQNVHVIVMLTREIENAMVKCGTYWVESSYGPLQLQLLDTSPPDPPSISYSTSADIGFFMSPREREKGSKQPSMIVRTFALSHRGYPGVPPRKVTHLQYLDWPDMNVPDDPRGVLELVKCVERAVQESTPGPSPSGSHSHSGSCCGSPSASSSPGKRGEDFFSSPPLGDASARRTHGCKGWRHPELDSKTGIAAFALGCSPPVLLHCSAGVGRTGGFIAVDAVLDAIKRELNQRRETRARACARACARISARADRRRSASVVAESGSGTESGGMDADADANLVRKEKPKEKIVGTIPIVMGDRKKARRHHPYRGTAKDGETSSSESLVVHVPFAEETAGLDTKWHASSSTREWAEQVLDQTHSGEEEQETELPPPFPLSMSLSLPTPSREGSPGGTSNSSGPSALNSADDSVGCNSGSSIGVDVEVGSRRSGSSSGRSGSSVSGSGSGGAFPPSSSVSVSHFGSQSNSGPVSISASNSGSGTNTSNSGFWGSIGADSGLVGLMRARLRDSSVTSLSGSDFSSEKPSMPLPQPSAVYIGTEEKDAMDVDRPPRSLSAPLQPAKSGVVVSNETNASHANNSNLRSRVQQIIGSSPMASFSTPALPTTTGTGRDPFFEGQDPVLCTSSTPSLDELLSPPKSFESGGNADVEAASRKSTLLSSDESEDVVSSGKAKSKLKAVETTPAISAAPSQGTMIKLISKPKQHKSINKTKPSAVQVAVAPSSMPPGPQSVEKKPVTEQVSSELDQRTTSHSVIDYKLPRQLHQDLSPAPLMCQANPIWTVVQDMREQRMSLCQSLRQYVFVHAAVIEGALLMVDEERELWGECTGSEGSPESARVSNREGEGDNDICKTASKSSDIMEIGHNQGSRDRTRSFPVVGVQSSTSSSQMHHMYSPPSKWKRGPSPTELLREDKSGIISFAKRPSTKRRTLSDDKVLTAFELAAGGPQVVPGGSSKVESENTIRLDMGPMTPEWNGSSATAKQ